MKIARMFAAWVSLGLLAALAIPLSLAKSQANPAKQGAGKQMGKHEKLEAAIESLHLTEDQQAKVKDILADAKTKRQALWADTSLSEEGAEEGENEGASRGPARQAERSAHA